MKIFFIRNAPNNIAWSLKVFPFYACDEITLIPVKKKQVFSCLSITIGIPIVNACTDEMAFWSVFVHCGENFSFEDISAAIAI